MALPIVLFVAAIAGFVAALASVFLARLRDELRSQLHSLEA